MPGQGGLKRLAQMQRNLVAEKIKVHPGLGTTPLCAAEYVAVKRPRSLQIGDVVGEVKQAKRCGRGHAGMISLGLLL